MCTMHMIRHKANPSPDDVPDTELSVPDRSFLASNLRGYLAYLNMFYRLGRTS